MWESTQPFSEFKRNVYFAVSETEDVCEVVLINIAFGCEQPGTMLTVPETSVVDIDFKQQEVQG